MIARFVLAAGTAYVLGVATGRRLGNRQVRIAEAKLRHPSGRFSPGLQPTVEFTSGPSKTFDEAGLAQLLGGAA